ERADLAELAGQLLPRRASIPAAVDVAAHAAPKPEPWVGGVRRQVPDRAVGRDREPHACPRLPAVAGAGEAAHVTGRAAANTGVQDARVIGSSLHPAAVAPRQQSLHPQGPEAGAPIIREEDVGVRGGDQAEWRAAAAWQYREAVDVEGR